MSKEEDRKNKYKYIYTYIYTLPTCFNDKFSGNSKARRYVAVLDFEGSEKGVE